MTIYDFEHSTSARHLAALLLVMLLMSCKFDAEEPKQISTHMQGSVQVLETVFTIPTLNRERKIWLYLPNDYDTSDKRYPVLYMHDGQNLFDEHASFAGEWYIDESLDSLSAMGMQSAIVVGIENSRDGYTRLDEYSPWMNERYKRGGDGDTYVNFIISTLKPFIDKHYRTLSDRAHTGIMGSSMGGLISLYAALQYQNIFGKVGVFSPSLWFSDQAFQQALTTTKYHDIDIYLIAGEQESKGMIRQMKRMYRLLENAGFDVFLELHPDGEHSERYWAREFPKAYEWLFLRV
ncbi:MAG: alpha/beta hydrolase-fold protein [Bacteroidota bacterium]